jgi:hypothetical protein
MTMRTLSMWLLLLASPIAGAADDAPGGDGSESGDEGGGDEGGSPGGGEGDGDDGGASPNGGGVSEGEAAPSSRPAPSPSSPAPADAVPEGRRPATAPDGSKAPRLVFRLGGGATYMQDPGWGSLSYRSAMGSVTCGLDVLPLHWLALGIGLGNAAEGSSATPNGSIRTTWRIGRVEGSVRATPAPEWLPVRPFVRGGGGGYVGRVELTENTRNSGNLAAQARTAGTPFVLLGGGIEIVSPRAIRRDGGLRRLRFGGGIAIEGGVRLGGGGAIPAAPGLQFGEFGTIDVGPGYAEIQAIVAF